MIITMINGMAMALADSVPGVSGGTIAFIMGFYERFLGAIHNLFRKDSGKRKEAFIYLIKFGLGWCIGLGSSVLVLSKVFESNVYFMSSLFLGLTTAAIPFIAHEEWSVMKGKYKNLIFTIIGLALVVGLTMFRENVDGIGAIHFNDLGVIQFIYLAFSGMLAISAMLLPGVSGSTILLILGVYVPTINSLNAILNLHFEYLPGVLALIAGIFIGVIFASKYIRMGFRKFRSQMLYFIMGLLLGSLYAITMGPTTLEIPKSPLSLDEFSILAFFIGILILVGLEWMKRIVEKKEKTV